MILTTWLMISAAIAVAVTLDMARLHLNRVGIPRAAWIIACIVAGPLAGAAYIWRRHAALKALIHAVWEAVGDSSEPLATRRQRLIALRNNGLISAEIYLRCWAELDMEKWRGGS